MRNLPPLQPPPVAPAPTGSLVMRQTPAPQTTRNQLGGVLIGAPDNYRPPSQLPVEAVKNARQILESRTPKYDYGTEFEFTASNGVSYLARVEKHYKPQPGAPATGFRPQDLCRAVSVYEKF